MYKLIARCIIPFPSLQRTWYAIPIRLIVGYGFMEHGYAKLARGRQAFIHAGPLALDKLCLGRHPRGEPAIRS
jgi:hypothetical protein